MSDNKPSYVPGLAGVPVTESSISYVDGKRGHLEYRGIDIEELAENSTFEEVSHLLLYGKLPAKHELDTLDEELRSHRRIKYRIIDMIKCFPDSTHPMDALQSVVAALGMFYLPAGSGRTCSDPQSAREACVRLIAKMPTIVAAHARMRTGDEPLHPRDDLNHAANFLYMLTGKEPDPLMARIMDVALIVHAEHTLNASTFSAM
ncbi:MAG: citrate/2-methylcitrate synthase, partial [Mariprofundaceae bacterium]